jgi:uncharacterized protein YcaQ
MPPLRIDRTTLRRFVLGQQGLWPGRRWRGKAGLDQALRAGCVIQIDPLRIVARSHDLVLQGRILDYTPAMLDHLLYTERAAFDYGGAVFVHPMPELPYWRVIMRRNSRQGRWAAFADQHRPVIDAVRAEITARGPLAGRDFKGNPVGPGNYRGTKDTGLALYYLWFSGELMTASRRGFERLYDLRERVAPPAYQGSATDAEADDFFALEIFHRYTLPTAREFRLFLPGAIQRRLAEGEAAARLADLLAAGTIVPLAVEGEPATQVHYALAEDLPLLEQLQAGQVPAAWQPLESSTLAEMTVLAPLEIASARGRAKYLFDFEYVWEVYKSAALRRWGYYTLPLLYGDRLVARFDSRLDRASRTLDILGYWQEDGTPALGSPIVPDELFRAAMRAGFRRFLTFLDADCLQGGPPWLADGEE